MLINVARFNDDQRVSILAASVTSMAVELKSLFRTNESSSHISETTYNNNKHQKDTNSSSEDETTTTAQWVPLSISYYLKHVRYCSITSIFRQPEGP